MRKIHSLVSAFLILASVSALNTQTYAANPSWNDHEQEEPPIGVVEPAYSLEDHYDSSEKINVKLNGEVLNSELKPVKVDETIMVPARDLFKKINMNIKFDQKNLVLTATKSDKIFKFSLKINRATLNGEDSILPQTPFVEQKRNRMFVPLRYVVESNGGTVRWDSK